MNNIYNSNGIECVIFDWAGTMVDYGCFAPMDSFVQAFRNKGIEITKDEARQPMGMMKKDHIKAICEMERVKNLWNEKYGRYPKGEDIDSLFNDFEPSLLKILPNYCDPIPGAVHLVNRLRGKSIKIGSTTGYVKSMMEIVEVEAEKKGYKPDNVVNSSQVPKGRPYPYMIWKNAIDLEVNDLSKIIKVGDTISDIKEGINANVWTVGVILGSSEMGFNQDEVINQNEDELSKKIDRVKEKFMEAGAHFTIDRISDLDGVIDIINLKLKNGEVPKQR